MSEAIKLAQKAKVLVESKEREIRIIKESNERENTLGELLRPLNKEKQEVMRNLLESVQTPRLKNAFEKYLPAVLADNKPAKASKVIAESVTEVTGDKSARVQEDEAQTESNVLVGVALARRACHRRIRKTFGEQGVGLIRLKVAVISIAAEPDAMTEVDCVELIR